MFTVTITKTTIEERPAGKEWLIVGEADGNGSGYGYTPEIVKKREVEQKIYEQTVDEIDITRVISAVNGGLYEVTPHDVDVDVKGSPETLIDPRHILSEKS